MLADWAAITAALVYFCLLFAVAHVGDAQGARWRRGPWRPLVYALTLAVYCTSWTFLGSVGFASRSGLDFLAIYIGPIAVFLFCGRFLRRVLDLAKAQNITSVADFVAARYGKNERVAALVALIAIIGTVPYIALQLKAISASVEIFIAPATLPAGPASAPRGIVDLPLLVALILAAFAVAFGTRRVDATEHQDGLMTAIATESVVKLVAFLSVGAFVTYGMFGGVAELVARAAAVPGALTALDFSSDVSTFVVMTMLSGLMIFTLPRQFHVTVVENHDAGDLRRAQWLFPLYLVAINIFVIPLAIAGQVLIHGAGFDRDMTVLALPILAGAPTMALVALIGGLSAATAMVIVESVALAIMASNHLVMPLLLRRRRAAALERLPRQDMDLGGLLLVIRRLSIVGLLLLGYLYFRSSSDAALASIGLMSFAAVAQIAPAFIGGMFWRDGNARGATAGLTVGILTWGYTMLLPSLAAPDGPLGPLVASGPFGIGLLKPTALLGLDLPNLVHGVLVSLVLNVLAFVGVSLTRAATPIERVQASVFVTPDGQATAQNFRLFRATVSVDDLKATITRYLGEERTSRAFDVFATGRGETPDGKREADVHTLRFAEHLLASAIGAASARLVLSLLLRRRNVSTKAALKLLDDASAAMQYSRDLLQNALDHAEQGVTVFDRDLRLSAWNRAFQDIFGLPPNVIRVGVGLDEIVRSNAMRGIYGSGRMDELIRQRLVSFTHQTEPFRLRLQPGDRVIEIRTNPLPDGGLVTTYTDVTDTVLAEEALERANETLEGRVRERTEELTRVNDELQAAKAIAEEANLSKTRFLAAASHDILQPLNAARLYTSALVETQTGEPVSSLSRNVDASLDAVEEILSAILDISRLDSGALKPDWSVFRIDELFRQLQVEFAPVAQGKGLELVFVPSSLSVRSDRRLLRRLLQNLISNAIKYTESGHILVGCRRRGGALRLSVHDTGLGIPPSKQRLVFREFQRLDQGARIARGLGLGLSIVERISRVLDHRLTLASQVGKGSVFSLDIPTAVPLPAAPAQTPAAAVPDRPLAGLVILAIDNEPAILDGMQRLLGNWGCVVLTAGSLKAALRAIRDADQQPSVLIVDYHLDDTDGIEVVTKLRWRLKSNPRALLVTADRSVGVREAALAKDILVLNKPLKPAALRATLARWHAGIEPIAAE